MLIERWEGIGGPPVAQRNCIGGGGGQGHAALSFARDEGVCG